MAAKGVGETFREIGHDLINIETNTILAAGMTGRKMPSYPHALHDIITMYTEFLVDEVGLDLDAYWTAFETNEAKSEAERKKPEGLEPAFLPDAAFSKDPDNGVATFNVLRWAAYAALAHAKEAGKGGHKITAETRTVLNRLRRNCDQLKTVVGLLARPSAAGQFIGKRRRDLIAMSVGSKPPRLPPAPPEHLTRIRKIWDIGTDRIVLQTIIQLDGDIIFRATKAYAQGGQHPLVEAHRRASDIGLKHWSSMFELIASLVGGLAGRIFDTKKS